MSHAPERKEKDCLNCGTTVQGRFCHVCGQENVVPREGFGKLVLHFFYDITHFDSKFFDTLRYLITKPGFLSKEYIQGRRASYLNPIRMYVFTSAFFFLVFFTIGNTAASFKLTGDNPYSQAKRDSLISEVREELKEDSSSIDMIGMLIVLTDTTRKEVRPTDLLPYTHKFQVFGTWGRKYANRLEYDSIQRGLPPGKRDSWLARLWNKKAIELNAKYRKDPEASTDKISDVIVHKIPYILFVSLPFFALILKLLYIRRKKFYYVDHGIFSVHCYILSFLLLLLAMLLGKANEAIGWEMLRYLRLLVVISWPVYIFIAMMNFYGQGFLKTFLKFFLLVVSGLITMTVIFVLFVVFSVFQL